MSDYHTNGRPGSKAWAAIQGQESAARTIANMPGASDEHERAIRMKKFRFWSEANADLSELMRQHKELMEHCESYLAHLDGNCLEGSEPVRAALSRARGEG